MSGLSLRAVTKEYRDAERALRVLDQVDFEFPASGSVSIMGRSGVGKSTLLHIMGGLDKPSSGSVVLDGTQLEKLNSDQLSLLRSRKVGFIFQFHHLLPEFDAVENVAMPLVISGVPETTASEQAVQTLKRVGLASRLCHRPGELSGGEQQRVAIARAIVARPALILADEPTGNLDAETSKAVQALLFEVQREMQSLLIVVTHSAELSAAMDLRLEMKPGGQLVAYSTT
ncbi:MAG: ABC transporter ATP-binding protein [Oligoflexia bacterium]|nr:ABC transporter ATP-binding protein [Oligoflexia bacterium]